MVVTVTHCHRLLVFLGLNDRYFVVEDWHATGSWFFQGHFFVEIVVENGRHAVSSAWGEQTVLEEADSFVHFSFAGFAAVFFFPGRAQTSFGMLDRFTFFPAIVVLHDFLLDFLLPVSFNQLNQLLLLIIWCLSQHLGIIARGLVLGRWLQGGRDSVSQWILMVNVTIVTGRSGVNRFVHAPGKINFGFRQFWMSDNVYNWIRRSFCPFAGQLATTWRGTRTFSYLAIIIIMKHIIF